MYSNIDTHTLMYNALYIHSYSCFNIKQINNYEIFIREIKFINIIYILNC